jgi:hypothetical protein
MSIAENYAAPQKKFGAALLAARLDKRPRCKEGVNNVTIVRLFLRIEDRLMQQNRHASFTESSCD